MIGPLLKPALWHQHKNNDQVQKTQEPTPSPWDNSYWNDETNSLPQTLKKEKKNDNESNVNSPFNDYGEHHGDVDPYY